MKKKKQLNKKIIFLIIAFLAIVLSFAFLVKAFYPATKTYHSDFLDITLDIPTNYSIEDKTIVIVLKKLNSNYKITLLRTGTNMETLDDYLLDIVDYNKLKITNRNNLIINELPAIKVDINGKTTYLFYNNNFIYSLETDSPDLYPDLDRIAESFRYEP